MRKAINFYWKTDYTVALGDIMDSGGLDGHPRNIPILFIVKCLIEQNI